MSSAVSWEQLAAQASELSPSDQLRLIERIVHGLLGESAKEPSQAGRTMATTKPRFKLDDFWTRLTGLEGRTIESLTGSDRHRIVRVDRAKKEYQIEYESGNRIVVRLDDLYALYRELYAHGSLSNSYMRSNCQRILGWKTWNRPGSAMFAILRLIDDTIRSKGGSLHLPGPPAVSATSH
jgi:hypothetical protein